MAGVKEPPKLELKMLAVPIILLAYNKCGIDWKQPEMILGMRIVYACVASITFLIYFVLRQMINKKSDKKKIWVPPKEQPSIPFLPAPEAPTPDQYEETCYEDHEYKLVQEAAQALLMSSCIAAFKYVLDSKKATFYNELFVKPGTAPSASEAKDDRPRVEQLPDEDQPPLSVKKQK